ncbi:TVP38/TMEM64 family protein [Streptomyces oceani]|uniref:TVP38/TMEM64 family membrane protein n=1 Tax=Streptomyces oceani TaxID=1075402 RepID=A0A1E7JMN7_9ACTN|nr:TVP38/TMEM64 family protein [Streptomyces oceani]OEU89537.1 hypothetical protein AN216_25600 [Streptomyces oceani]
MSVPVVTTEGLQARFVRTLLAPWCRFGFLVLLLALAASGMLVYEPQRYLTSGWLEQLSGPVAIMLFLAAYCACTTTFVPRPFLNLAAGALFGTQGGLAMALAGTVLGAAMQFGLGRLLGQGAVRPLLRARILTVADRQLSQHGFRSVLAMRLFPGIPFAVSNYAASFSQMRWFPFLSATALGSVPNTAAYAVAGSEATSPTSPAFLVSVGFIALSGLAAAVTAWRKRARLRERGGAPQPATSPQD